MKEDGKQGIFPGKANETDHQAGGMQESHTGHHIGGDRLGTKGARKDGKKHPETRREAKGPQINVQERTNGPLQRNIERTDGQEGREEVGRKRRREY